MSTERCGMDLLHCGQLALARERFWSEASQSEERGDVEGFALAALGLGGLWVHEHRATVERARVSAWQTRALATPGVSGSLARRLRARTTAENAYLGSTVTELSTIVDEARHAADPVALAESLSMLHHCLLGPHFGHQRMALAEELLTTAALSGRPIDAVMGLLWRTVDLVLAGDRRAARSLHELNTQLEDHRCDAVRYVGDCIGVTTLMRAGSFDAAEAAAQRCFEFGSEVGDADALGFYGAQLVALRWMTGRAGELLGLLAELDESTTVAEGNAAFTAALASLAADAGDVVLARRALARLRPDLYRLAPSSAWLATLTGAVEASYLLGDAEVAADAYRLLVPFGSLPVMASLGVACYGSAQRPLGLAAAMMGDLDTAVTHLEAAVDADLALGNEPCHAISRATLADVLDRRDRAGDRQRAATLREGAVRDAQLLGMTARADRWTAQQHQATNNTLACRRQGRLWMIEDGARSATVADSVGMRYLAQLIAYPDRAIAALDLAADHAVAPTARHDVIDSQALREFRRRTDELRADIDQAECDADIERASRARAELDVVVEELRRCSGLRGRARGFADSPERARTAVRKALTRALDAVTAADPQLGEELHARLVTGTRCMFVTRPQAVA